MPQGLTQNHSASNRDIEGAEAVAQGNRNPQIRGIMDFLRNPCALPSQEERVATVVGDLGIGVIRVASQQEQPAVSCFLEGVPGGMARHLG